MRVVLVVAVCAAFSVGARAADSTDSGFNFLLSAGATRSDNAGRTQLDRQGETSVDAGLSTGFQYRRQQLDSRLNADLRFISHSYGDYSNQLTGGLAGDLSWGLARWLRWTVSDNFGQSLINSQDVATPDNTQNTNIVSTGPDFQVPLGQRTSILLQGRWQDAAYQKSDFGTRQYSGTVGVSRQLSERASVSLNGSSAYIDYKDLPGSSNYHIQSAYLAWNGSGVRTTLNLRAGYSALVQNQDTTHSALVDVSLTRRLAARSSLSLNVSRNFGSAADLLQRDQGVYGVAATDRPVGSSADPLRADQVALSWAFQGARTSVNVTGNWRRELHRTELDQNRRSWGGTLRASHQLGGRLAVNLFGDYANDDFQLASLASREWSAGCGVSWRFTQSFGTSLDWVHSLGSGDTSQGPGTRNYTENRYTMRLTWSPAR